MKKKFIYGIFLYLILVSCSKQDTDQGNGPIGLTAIETDSERIEFIYDKQHRITKCNSRTKSPGGWHQIHEIAIISYDQEKIAKIDIQNIGMRSDNFETTATLTFTYNSNNQITQRKLRAPRINGTYDEAIASFNYDNQNRLITSSHLSFETNDPIKALRYNEQGNLIIENYLIQEGATTRTGTFEYIYDTKKNKLAENNLGQFLFVTSLVPDHLDRSMELLFSRNHPMKINSLRTMDYTGNPAPISKRWKKNTSYINEYNADGYLTKFSYAIEDDFPPGTPYYTSGNYPGNGNFIFGNITIE